MADTTNVFHKFELQGRFLIVIVQTLNESSMMWMELKEIIYGCQITMLDFFMHERSIALLSILHWMWIAQSESLFVTEFFFLCFLSCIVASLVLIV